ncbi:MAG: hypothetical protein IK055_07930 [Lachnospiraceae bacterium]|nr:hypothetical protein [Lachnospiraceae bacterium]
MAKVEMVCWYGAFALGVAGLLSGILYLLFKKGVREEHFAKAAGFEFAASWILFIPEELFNDIPRSVPFLRVIESIITALLKTFNIYLGDGSKRVAYAGHPIFSALYATLVTVVNIVLLLFVAGFLASFFDGPFQRIRLSLHKRRSIVLFSECNDKTLATAESIRSKRKMIVFANCGRNTETARKDRIAAIKGVRFDGTVTEVLKKTVGKSKRMEVFLFGDREEDNLAELEHVCGFLEGKRTGRIRVYTELSETPWSLYDEYLETHNSADGEKLVINFVRTEENFAYNNLLQNSIFETAIERGDGEPREIKFLLVGMNERNLELLKAVLHLSQMPGYRVTVMVLDPGASRKRLLCKMPEICDERDVVGDAVYRILYRQHVLTETDQFEEIIRNEFADFTFAFINDGDNLRNANLAMRLNALCYREQRNGGYRIQVNIEDEDMCNRWNPELTKNIDVVGTRRAMYDYSFITMSNIEKGTVAIHNVRYPKGEPGSPAWISYCNNEYNRHSVYARTLSFKYKVWVIDRFYNSDYGITTEDRMWKVYEHMRWNVYTRTLGLVLADRALLDESGELDRKLRGIARVHNDLVKYDDLLPAEQDKDALVLTPKIVEILKSI